eukprot:m.181378 g.181378  ORF g.181378 m.181378 type:complete len:366 (-) comp15243_c0_seq1:184-1281(-)
MDSEANGAAAPNPYYGGAMAALRWQHSAEIRAAIREKMFTEGACFVPHPTFLDEGAITPNMRSILAQWLLSLCEANRCNPSVFSLCMMYVDQYLSTSAISSQRLQCLGSAALLLAAKKEGDRTTDVNHLCQASDMLFTPIELKNMELQLLVSMDWRVFKFGPHDYLWECVIELGDRFGMSQDALRGLLHDAEIYTDICYLEHSMAVRGPVTIAAAVIEYAIRTCKRGPLLAYPGATVLELNFVDQKTKDNLDSLLEEINHLADAVLGNDPGTPPPSATPVPFAGAGSPDDGAPSPASSTYPATPTVPSVARGTGAALRSKDGAVESPITPEHMLEQDQQSKRPGEDQADAERPARRRRRHHSADA